MERNKTKFIPTLTPTYEQWKSLSNYLIHHETSLQRRFGAVKILPPTRWIPLIKNPYDLRQIKIYMKQEILPSKHQSNVFYIENSQIEKRRPMTYEEYKTLAENDTYRLSDSITNPIADYFWSTLSHRTSLFVPNIDESLFNKRENVFNMSNLPSLLKYYPQTIPGVTTPSLHLGMWANSTGLHTDDYDLISLHYLHHGAPKIWYIIHPSSYMKFEELVNELKLFSDVSSSCLSPLQHQTLLINPSFLESHSIDYFKIEQKSNELVIIFPGIYHFSFDTGFNLSETVKYALPSLLEFQRRSPRLCSCSISSLRICNINRRFFTEEILDKFREEYLTTKSTTCIDLSSDEDNQSITDEQLVSSTPQNNLSLYSSSSSTNNNTPNSTDLFPTFLPSHSSDDLWNIFDRMPSPTKSDPPAHHPYSSTIPCHITSMYSSCPYSSLRSTMKQTSRRQRRKCYACRQQGHVRSQCPFISHR